MKLIASRLTGMAVGVALAFAGTDAFAAGIVGAGASFADPLYAAWAAGFGKAEKGFALDYQSDGSSDGIAALENKTVEFGATDEPLAPPQLKAAGLAQFPTVVGGVVPVVNIPGIKPGELVLDGKTLAALYLGKILYWDNPAIKHLNPDIAVPHLAVVTVHRTDGSGTTFILTNYLDGVSRQWANEVGAAASVDWPSGFGVAGNEGVATSVKQSLGALGYVDYSCAKRNGMAYVRMIDRDGRAVRPSPAAFRAAAARADWVQSPDFDVVPTDRRGRNAWPLTAATFVVVDQHPQDPQRLRQVLAFFQWAYAHGGRIAERLDYTPLPRRVAEAVTRSWHDNIAAAAVP